MDRGFVMLPKVHYRVIVKMVILRTRLQLIHQRSIRRLTVVVRYAAYMDFR